MSEPRAGFIEYLFAIGALLVFEGAFLPVLRGTASAADPTVVAEGDPIARFAQAGIVLVLVVITALRWRVMRPALMRGIPYGMIILYCLISTRWSEFPLTTFRRSVALFSCFLFGYYAYVSFGSRVFIRLLGVTTIVASIGSVLLYGAAPSLAVDVTPFGEDFGVKGVFAQKNELSVYSLLGLCACIYLAFLAKDRTRFDRLFRYGMIPVLGGMALSRGMTSMIASVAVVALAVRLWAGSSSHKVPTLIYYVTGSVIFILVCIVAVDPDLLFKALGKDATLTGRLPLWVECIDEIKERPLFGSGYAAFWNPLSRVTQYIWTRIGWPAPNAHNGFLQLALDLGIFGTSFYLYLIVRLVWLTVKAVRVGELDEARWLSLFLIAMLIENLDEGTLAWPDAMAMQVAFGTAMTETWWESFKARLHASKGIRAAHAHALRVLARPGQPARPSLPAGE